MTVLKAMRSVQLIFLAWIILGWIIWKCGSREIGWMVMFSALACVIGWRCVEASIRYYLQGKYTSLVLILLGYLLVLALIVSMTLERPWLS